MQISLRSQLIAGAAAIVGTSAVAITPIAAPAAQLSTLHMPNVALTALANPVAELMGSMSWVSNDLFNATDTYEPFNMFQGLIPEWTYINQPIATQMNFNHNNYVNTLLQGLVVSTQTVVPGSFDSSFVTLSNMVWDLPAATLTAVQQLFSGNLDAAIATMAAAIVTPITSAIERGIETVTAVVQQIIGNAINVITDIPNLVGNFVNTAVAVGQTLAATAIGAVTNVFDAISSGDLEGAWNAAVVGAWGREGYAGALETLTIGPGYGTWGAVDYVPSFRVFGEGAILSIANDLGADWDVNPPAPAPETAAAAASVKAAASVAAEAATTETATTAGIDAPKSDDSVAAPAAIAANAAESASTAGDSSKAGDSDAKGKDAKGSSESKASAGGKGHAKAGSARTKADHAA